MVVIFRLFTGMVATALLFTVGAICSRLVNRNRFTSVGACTGCKLSYGSFGRTTSFTLLRASKMPNFSDEEQEELRRIMAGEQIDFSTNVPVRRKKKATASPPPPPQQQPKSKPIQSPTSTPVSRPVIQPNSNWRKALTEPSPSQVQRSAAPGSKPPKAVASGSSAGGADEFSFMDLDYDDFEMAMREAENAGMNPMGGGSKNNNEPEVDRSSRGVGGGLTSGTVIPSSIWTSLRDSDNKESEIRKVHKDMNDIVVFYADPRRMTDEFKLILTQLDNLPRSKLKIATAAINGDDSNDHRKFKKKNTVATLLLSDPSKKFLEVMQCRRPRMLQSALCLMAAGSGDVLKIWYEGEWDPVTTKDLIIEEVQAYRQNPAQFMQSQIGIR